MEDKARRTPINVAAITTIVHAWANWRLVIEQGSFVLCRLNPSPGRHQLATGAKTEAKAEVKQSSGSSGRPRSGPPELITTYTDQYPLTDLRQGIFFVCRVD
jgi:hypothetical protein